MEAKNPTEGRAGAEASVVPPPQEPTLAPRLVAHDEAAAFVSAASGSDALPMRRWILLKTPDFGFIANSRRIEQTALFQLAKGTIWMLRMDAARDWDADALRILIDGLCGEPPLIDLNGLPRDDFERHLGCKVRFIAPSFDARDGYAWPAIDIATRYVIDAECGGSRHLARRSGLLERAVPRLARRIVAALDEQLTEFAASLDPALLAVCKRNGRFNAEGWNFVSTRAGACYRNRHQFLACFPYFADLATGALISPCLQDALCEVIDEGHPLVEYLARRFHVGPAVIRHVAPQSPHVRTNYWRRRIPWALRLIERLPKARRPVTESDWNALGVLTRTAAALFGDPLASRQAFDWVCARSTADADALCDLARNPDDLARVVATIRDYRKTLASVITHLALPHDAGRREATLRRAALQLLDARHVPMRFARLWDLADAWRRADTLWDPAAERENADRSAIQRQTYLPLIPAPIVLGDWRITPLVSRRELLNTAHQMHNCLASYHSICEGGAHLLCTVGQVDETGIRTVAEFALWIDGAGNVRPVLQQHRGPWNTLPPPECVAAIDDLLALALEPNLQRHLKLLRTQFPRKTRFDPERATDSLRVAHGADWIENLVRETLKAIRVPR